jgi:hypothetical protein
MTIFACTKPGERPRQPAALPRLASMGYKHQLWFSSSYGEEAGGFGMMPDATLDVYLKA